MAPGAVMAIAVEYAEGPLFRTEHCLYVYTKGAFPGVCDASSCYLLAGFLTSTYFLGFWPASTKSFEAPGEETSAVVATRSCLLFRRALT